MICTYTSLRRRVPPTQLCVGRRYRVLQWGGHGYEGRIWQMRHDGLYTDGGSGDGMVCSWTIQQLHEFFTGATDLWLEPI